MFTLVCGLVNIPSKWQSKDHLLNEKKSEKYLVRIVAEHYKAKPRDVSGDTNRIFFTIRIDSKRYVYMIT